MALQQPPVPIIAELINGVDLPEYPLGRPPRRELTEEGEKRKRSHDNSRSVKNMAPIHHVIRGNPNDIVEYGRDVAKQQLLNGCYTNNDDETPSLATFSPPEMDHSLVHEVETAVVLSTYIHTVYNATRVCLHTKPSHNNGHVGSMRNIVTLPEDTISFRAKLRHEHTTTDGTIRKVGERDTLSLRCDMKLGIPVCIEKNQPFEFPNARMQTILPLEFKKRSTFTAEDVEKGTMDISELPASVQKRARIGQTHLPQNSSPIDGAGPEIFLDEENDIDMLEGKDDDVDMAELQESKHEQRYFLRARRSNQRAPRKTKGQSIRAPVAAGLKQMSAYSASERVPFSSLMTGDFQLFAEFPAMVVKSTIEEQWDSGIGDYAIVYVVRKSGDWLAGIFGMLVWGWVFFLSLM